MCRVAATKPAQSASLKLQNHGRYPVSRCFPVASTSKYYLKMTNIISVLYKIILFAEFTVYNVVKTLRPKAWKDGQRLIVFTVSDFKRFDLEERLEDLVQHIYCWMSEKRGVYNGRTFGDF